MVRLQVSTRVHTRSIVSMRWRRGPTTACEPSRAVAIAAHCKYLTRGGYIAARDLLHAPARLASVRRSSAPAAIGIQHTTAQTTTQQRLRLGWQGSQVGECVRACALGQCGAVLCCRYVPRPIRAEKPKELNRKPPKVPHAHAHSPDAATSANVLAMCRTQIII